MVNNIDKIRPPRLVADLHPSTLSVPWYVDTTSAFEEEHASLEQDIFRLQLELPSSIRENVAAIGWTDPRQAIEITVRYLTPTPERYEQMVEGIYQRTLESTRPDLGHQVEAWRDRMYSIHALTIMGAYWITYQGEKARRR